MVFVPIGHINHSKRPSLSHSVSQIGVHLAIQLDSSIQKPLFSGGLFLGCTYKCA